MKTTAILPLAAVSGVLFLSNCAEDPSQNVPSADITEVEESETPETANEPASPPAESESTSDTSTMAPSAAAEPTAFSFTDESTIEFVGSKVTGSHEGGFKKFSGTFQIAGDEPGQGPHHIEIDTTSVWSDNEKLTEHLKSPDFFDVEKFPTSKFTLDSVESAEGDDMYQLSGELDLHGVKKTIAFPAKITKGDGKVHLDAEFSINRRDFDINYDGKANDLIRDGVVIKLAMVAKEQ
ncbi:MAG: YceI family protein [Verrucomicrobiota bacterium]